MKLTKCEHGHVYDGDKFTACPYCAGKTDEEILGTDAAAETAGVAAPTASAASESPAVLLPVRGWLVAVDGPAQGRDFRLTEGRNFVGAGPEVDIDLSADPETPTGRVASVVYDPQANAYFVHPCETKQLFYQNEAAVLQPQPLGAGDVLRVGGTRLAFVPFDGYDQQKER